MWGKRKKRKKRNERKKRKERINFNGASNNPYLLLENNYIKLSISIEFFKKSGY
jgi:hypothetical protein